MRASGSGSGGTTSTAARMPSGARSTVQVPPAAARRRDHASCSAGAPADPDQAAAPVEEPAPAGLPRSPRTRPGRPTGGPRRARPRRRARCAAARRRGSPARPRGWPASSRRRRRPARPRAGRGGSRRSGAKSSIRTTATAPCPASSGTRSAASAGRKAAPDTPYGEPSAADSSGHARPGVQHRQHEAAGQLRRRQHLQRDLGQHGERAVAAGQQLAQVEPGHVLQHPAAGADHLARAVDRAHAHDVVPHRAPGDPARPRQVGRHHAADRLRALRRPSSAGQVGRLGDQMLPALGQLGLELRQRWCRRGPR